MQLRHPNRMTLLRHGLGEEATIKTFTHHGTTVVLQAANPADRDITVHMGDDFQVLGVICGIFRPFTVNAEVKIDQSMAPIMVS